MPNSDIKSSFDVGATPPSSTEGQAGRNGGPFGSDKNDAQFIQTYGFRNVQTSAATVEGSFSDTFQMQSPGQGSAQPSPRPACNVFSSMGSDDGMISGKAKSGGGGSSSVNSASSY